MKKEGDESGKNRGTFSAATSTGRMPGRPTDRKGGTPKKGEKERKGGKDLSKTMEYCK